LWAWIREHAVILRELLVEKLERMLAEL